MGGAATDHTQHHKANPHLACHGCAGAAVCGGTATGRKRSSSAGASLLHAMASSVTIKDVIDVDKNGKVSKSEFAHALDENKDGKVTKHEAVDLDRDGKVEKKEKDLMDSNNDAKITRHEVLAAPDADSNHDGKVTPKEKHAVLLFPPPPPPLGAASSAQPLHTPRPKRTSWAHGYWDAWEDMIDEFVLLAVFFVTLNAFYKGIQKKLSGKSKYKTVAKVGQQEMDSYGPDPGLELAKEADDEGSPAVDGNGQRLNDSEIVGGS